jgi:hypothetical protein
MDQDRASATHKVLRARSRASLEWNSGRAIELTKRDIARSSSAFDSGRLRPAPATGVPAGIDASDFGHLEAENPTLRRRY